MKLLGKTMGGLAHALIVLVWGSAPSSALVGGAPVVRDIGPGRHIVMIISTRGNVCTGTALARDLVLTAAHCVAPPATYRVSTPALPGGLGVQSIAVHPRYDPRQYANGRVTVDVALLKLMTPMPNDIIPATIAENSMVAPGDRLVIAGFGTTAAASDAGLGLPRAASLVVTGKPGSLQIRLVDPATNNNRAGIGACTGDSGGPAFRETAGAYKLIGVVSWSTGPGGTSGCGGLTGVTPLAQHLKWIVETMEKLGSPIAR